MTPVFTGSEKESELWTIGARVVGRAGLLRRFLNSGVRAMTKRPMVIIARIKIRTRVLRGIQAGLVVGSAFTTGVSTFSVSLISGLIGWAAFSGII